MSWGLFVNIGIVGITDISRQHYTRSPFKVVVGICTWCAKHQKSGFFLLGFFSRSGFIEIKLADPLSSALRAQGLLRISPEECFFYLVRRQLLDGLLFISFIPKESPRKVYP